MVKLRSGYNAFLWAMERQFLEVSETVSARIHSLRLEVEKELGFSANFNACALGPLVLWTTRGEQRRLAGGKTYKPPPSANAPTGSLIPRALFARGTAFSLRRTLYLFTARLSETEYSAPAPQTDPSPSLGPLHPCETPSLAPTGR